MLPNGSPLVERLQNWLNPWSRLNPSVLHDCTGHYPASCDRICLIQAAIESSEVRIGNHARSSGGHTTVGCQGSNVRGVTLRNPVAESTSPTNVQLGPHPRLKVKKAILSNSFEIFRSVCAVSVWLATEEIVGSTEVVYEVP